MVHAYEIEGLRVQTGDLLCTTDGGGADITVNITGNTWSADGMRPERGPFVDMLYGAAYPLLSVDIDPARAIAIREDVAAYCIRQAELNKPYNLNFFDSDTEGSFYCSQLAYRAYLRNGIDLNTGASVWSIPGSEKIVLPQEIWDGCVHEKVGGREE
jgi:hypothetical protein